MRFATLAAIGENNHVGAGWRGHRHAGRRRSRAQATSLDEGGLPCEGEGSAMPPLIGEYDGTYDVRDGIRSFFRRRLSVLFGSG